jgi:diketogulonate reductase-like aldo/keto reductase
VQFALAAGVRHFDVATQYGTNEQVGQVLQDYMVRGTRALNITTPSSSINNNEESLLLVKPPRTATQRAQELFLTHKVSNAEQATLSPSELQANLQSQAKVLGKPVLDLVMLHSPLSDNNRRLQAYAALCDYVTQGKAKAVGVCHFSVAHLDQLVQAGLPPPHVIQLQLSPFNTHADVVAWAASHGSQVECAAWSKLSGTTGPAEGWAKVAEVAATKGITKQKVLIRWALQKGYSCVPRSSAQYKVERAAIRENAWISNCCDGKFLSDTELALLDSLNEHYPAGKLGVTDGWETADMINDKWDPTLLPC